MEHLSFTVPTAGCLHGLNADRSRGRGMGEMTSGRLLPAIGLDCMILKTALLRYNDIQKLHIFNVCNLLSLDICIHL